MEPIISPWIIYTVDVLSSLAILSMFIIILGIVVLVFWPIIACETGIHTETMLKYEKITAVITIISLLFFIFLPSKQTMLTMLVLQYTTPDNISLVQDNIIDFIQKITEAIKGVK